MLIVVLNNYIYSLPSMEESSVVTDSLPIKLIISYCFPW